MYIQVIIEIFRAQLNPPFTINEIKLEIFYN